MLNCNCSLFIFFCISLFNEVYNLNHRSIDIIKCRLLEIFYLLIRFQGQSLISEEFFEIASFNYLGIWILGNHFIAGSCEERKDDGD